jgi:hypothetical protein
MYILDEAFVILLNLEHITNANICNLKRISETRRVH